MGVSDSLLGHSVGYVVPTNPISVVLTLIIAGVAAYYYTYVERWPDLSHIPLLGEEMSFADRQNEYRTNAKAFLEKGYRQYNKKGKPFRIETSEGPKVVLGIQQLDEVKAKPDTVVGNLEPVFKSVMEEYTHIGAPDDIVVTAIKTQLSTQLINLSGALAAQTDKSLAQDFPACDDWEDVHVYQRFLHVVAAVSTRIFLGEELTDNEEWLGVMITYTSTLFECSQAIKARPAWMRPLIYRTLPQYKAMIAAEKTALRLITPVIKARRESMNDPHYVEPLDMTQWMMAGRVKHKFHDEDYHYMAKAQLQLSVAAIHTTSMALTNMCWDLVANPEYQDIIRDEVKEALACNNQSWEGPIMHKLPKTDSIMKESQRHEPVGLTVMDRWVKQPFTLKDGTYLPAGINVTSNSYAITHDDDVLQSGSDPNKFDGLRYYNMRNKLTKMGSETSEVGGKHQFVSVSSGSLMFGYGKHACPGRFFAGNELKLIIVKFLERYDIKFDEKKRHANHYFEVANIIDHTKSIKLKRRPGVRA